MKPHWWQRWGRPAFIGCSCLAIVMTAIPDDGSDTVQKPRASPEKAAQALSARPKGAAPRAPDESRVELERLERGALRQDGEEEVGNAFGATSWYVPPPPPPPVKPPPPPKPTAPPMPFSFLGFYEEAPGKIVMLVKGDRLYTVSVGDVIENTYRVERISAGAVELTYLPLNIKQSISTGSATS